MSRAWVMVPLLALALFPSALAVPLEAVELRLGAGLVEIDLMYVATGDVAASLRQEMDADQDGAVTEAESGAMAARFGHGFTAWDRCVETVRGIRWGGSPPLALQHARSSFRDAEGSAAADAPLRHAFTFLFAFELDGRTNVSIDGRLLAPGLHEHCRPAGADVPGASPQDYAWAPVAGGASVTVRPFHDASIDEDSILAEDRVHWRGDRFEAQGEEGLEMLRQGLAFSFEGNVTYSAGVMLPLPVRLSPWYGLGAALTAALGSWAWISRFSWLGLFSRLEAGRILDHPLRRDIHDSIAAQPGLTLQELKERLGRGHGTLVYHLATLQRHGKVRILRASGRTQLFLPQHPVRPHLSTLQQEILRLVEARPGIDQTALLGQLGGTRHRLSAQLRRLARRGLVEVEREGRWRRYYARDSVDAAV